MRRALVLTNESARHPFRAVFVHSQPLEREIAEMAMAIPNRSAPSQFREDVSFFLLSYVSGLIIFFGMIA